MALSMIVMSFGRAESVKMIAKLSPAGSFTIEGKKLAGKVTKDKDIYKAKNIVLNLTDLKTGMELRDKHVQEYLETKKYPIAVLTEGQGKGSKFSGKLKIRNIIKPIAGTYELKGKQGLAKFKVKMSEYKIKSASYMGLGVNDEINVTVEMMVP